MLDDRALQRFINQRQIEAQIVSLPAETATVATAAEALGVTTAQIIKSLLFFVGSKTILVISNGTAKVDRKRIARHFDVGKRQVRLARPADVEEIAGFGVGAMPPFGHKKALPTLIDPGVVEQEEIYGGGGTTSAMLRLTPQTLLEVTAGEVVPVS